MQGYNGTVLAYGQTGSGKTHTMSGGVGHYGVKERGVTPRVIDHVFAHVAAIKKRLKPGEKIEVSASAVEIYNEEFRDLSKTPPMAGQRSGWDSVRSSGQAKELKLQVSPHPAGPRTFPLPEPVSPRCRARAMFASVPSVAKSSLTAPNDCTCIRHGV